ncbi:MAG TPA: ArsR family transcriptional regulator [Gemmatimonadales bacterium]|nr:ArsR family transcriptional regulator [Gemmatimonadales bacterium]
MAKALSELTGETRSKLLDLLRRSPRTVNELAAALGVTDNAVRTHLAGLTRDGLVEQVSTDRSTGGKPARRYGLTTAGGELFPKAYAVALEGLVEELARTEGWERARALLQGVGTRVADQQRPSGDLAARVATAADALRQLGADLEVETTSTGWALQGYACPLSAVTSGHPEVCALVTAIVSGIAGRPAVERCAHGPTPRCRFEVAS